MTCPDEEKIKRLEHQNSELRQNVYELQERIADLLVTNSGLKDEVFTLLAQADGKKPEPFSSEKTS